MRPSTPGVVVSAVWIWQLLGIRWRAQSNEIDRLCRALGFFWRAMIYWNSLLEGLIEAGYVKVACAT